MNRLMLMRMTFGLALIWVTFQAVHQYRTSHERRLRRIVHDLLQEAQFSGPEEPVIAAKRSRALTRFFEPDLTVSISDAPRLTSRAEFISLVFEVRTQLEQLQAELHGLELDIEPGAGQARMQLAVRLTARRDGRQGQGWREYELEWVRPSEVWRCRAIREISTIERPL